MTTDDHDGDDPLQDRGDNDKPTRDARGRWLPGNCPNRKGRPKKKPKVFLDQASVSPRCRQSIQMKWIEPSAEWAAMWPKTLSRKLRNSSEVISPEAIANSRCRTLPRPET